MEDPQRFSEWLWGNFKAFSITLLFIWCMRLHGLITSASQHQCNPDCAPVFVTVLGQPQTGILQQTRAQTSLASSWWLWLDCSSQICSTIPGIPMCLAWLCSQTADRAPWPPAKPSYCLDCLAGTISSELFELLPAEENAYTRTHTCTNIFTCLDMDKLLLSASVKILLKPMAKWQGGTWMH